MHRTSRAAIITVLAGNLTVPAAIGVAEPVGSGEATAGMETHRVVGYSAMRAIGAPIRDHQGADLGTIHDIVFGADGRAHQVVVAVGGVLGIGAKRVVVPYDRLTFAPDHEILLLGSAAQVDSQAPVTYPDDDQLLAILAREGDGTSGETAVPPEDVNRFLRESRRTMDEWQGQVQARISELKQDGEQAATEAARALEQGWSDVEKNWEDVTDATDDAWQEAQAGFERAWSAFETAWQETGSDQ